MPTDDWNIRLQRTQAEARRFDALLGEWEGRGEAHGLPTSGRLSVQRILDGSIIEVAEFAGTHEDRCFYRFEPEQGGFVVMHLLPGATVREHPVEFTDEGLIWVSPPGEPNVEWVFGTNELRCDVLWPGEALPEVRMYWTRRVET